MGVLEPPTMTLKQREYLDWVLQTVRQYNPYQNTPNARAWAIGFLAANLADILSEDPVLTRRYKRRLERVTSKH